MINYNKSDKFKKDDHVDRPFIMQGCCIITINHSINTY